jgi:hypothetical protein
MNPEEDDMIYFLVDRGCYRYGDFDVELDCVIIVGINLQRKRLQSYSYEPMTMLVPALHPEHLFHKVIDHDIKPRGPFYFCSLSEVIRSIKACTI